MTMAALAERLRFTPKGRGIRPNKFPSEYEDHRTYATLNQPR